METESPIMFFLCKLYIENRHLPLPVNNNNVNETCESNKIKEPSLSTIYDKRKDAISELRINAKKIILDEIRLIVKRGQTTNKDNVDPKLYDLYIGCIN